MIKIEKNIPMPLGAKMLRSALNSMSVGDSFLVGTAGVNQRCTVHREMKNHSATFSSRIEGDGMRVWRIA